MPPAGLFLCRLNGSVEMRDLSFDPRDERRTEIKADLGVVIHNVDDFLFAVQNTAGGVGGVTFGGDSLVPIMVRVG